ncbi:hypothetical protein SOCEGT47_018240 [Sorangium cellulosum]|jgi:hypothetical protein|uniref:Secreted protein n=1 Tax=Sorangium cellulosum TaxID=56 RepID=A0A4V0ND40_SORCE|nr:hypothetical protein [Sorangium cellulosum]AUX21342.1 hypothetical protein SOCEGT47_018240 [Sorangium cellulosum]
MTRARLSRAAALAACAACAAPAALSCRGDADAPPPPAPTAAPAPRPPVDQVLPGELAEGVEQAFGLPIPRRMRVSARFSDAVFATGEISAERVANYVRTRVLAGRVETGPGKTIFAQATVKSAPQRKVRIEVVSRAHVSELVVRDETRPPPEPGLSVEERWRRHGLTPDGKVLDPTRLE